MLRRMKLIWPSKNWPENIIQIEIIVRQRRKIFKKSIKLTSFSNPTLRVNKKNASNETFKTNKAEQRTFRRTQNKV